MAKTKTTATGVDVSHYINSIEDEQKRKDALQLVQLMSKITGEKAYMWGPSIIGFGNYHYRYASGHEGDAPLAGFAPRKPAFSIYLSGEFPGRDALLKKLGKYKVAKACLYVKQLSDIDLPVLEQMITASTAHTKKLYPA
jgi:hypothetical protein